MKHVDESHNPPELGARSGSGVGDNLHEEARAVEVTDDVEEKKEGGDLALDVVQPGFPGAASPKPT